MKIEISNKSKGGPVTHLAVVACCLFMAVQTEAAEYSLHNFKKLQLTDEFWSEAAAIADINRDGHMDIVVGPYWYEGPDFKKRHEFYPATRTFKYKRPDGAIETRAGFDGISGNIQDSEMHYVAVHDFDGDGWPDILVVGLPGGGEDASKAPHAYWYENPGRDGLKNGVPWTRHLISDQVDNFAPVLVDLLHDGKLVLLCMSGGQSESSEKQVGYLQPDPTHPTDTWTFHSISFPSKAFRWWVHGLGFGDLNGDGRADILHSDGWWEQPASLINDPVWQYHPFPFHVGPNQIKQYAYFDGAMFPNLYDVTSDGIPTAAAGNYGGSQMYVDDVNGDGLPDVVTSIAAHGYGLAWWEQMKGLTRDGERQFRRHMIINRKPEENKYGVAFSEMQALAYADIDGDGLKDIVTGKRFWGHGSAAKVGIDPESDAPAVLYWFQQVRNADGTIDFVPHLIDDNSGAGTQIAIGDVNGDGKPDIVVANKKGAFVFIQQVRAVSKEEWEKAQPPILYPTGK